MQRHGCCRLRQVTSHWVIHVYAPEQGSWLPTTNSSCHSTVHTAAHNLHCVKKEVTDHPPGRRRPTLPFPSNPPLVWRGAGAGHPRAASWGRSSLPGAGQRTRHGSAAVRTPSPPPPTSSAPPPPITGRRPPVWLQPALWATAPRLAAPWRWTAARGSPAAPPGTGRGPAPCWPPPRR